MNAVKAMQKAPVKQLEIRTKSDDDWVHIFFTDTGVGIPDAEKERIFNLMTSYAHADEKKHFGFGLWWVRTFLHSKGGSIEVTSQEGRGSTFTVRLAREVNE